MLNEVFLLCHNSKKIWLQNAVKLNSKRNFELNFKLNFWSLTEWNLIPRSDKRIKNSDNWVFMKQNSKSVRIQSMSCIHVRVLFAH